MTIKSIWKPSIDPRPSMLRWHGRITLIRWVVPSGVGIAIAAHCNRRCNYCSQAYAPMAEKHIDPALWKIFLFRLREFGWRGMTGVHSYNEVGNTPHSERFVKEVIDNGSWVQISSNGDFPDAVEKWMQVHPWKVRVLITQHPPTTPAWTEAVAKLKARHPFRIAVRRLERSELHNGAGTVPTVKNPVQLEDCYRQPGISIDVNGYVTLCCIDYNSVNKIGNIADTALAVIWERMQPRFEILRQGIPAMQLCQSCNFVGRQVPL